MSVQPPRLLTQGVAFSTVALLALGACDDPVANTDLRPEGPPEVLAVLVQNDADSLFFEQATFCKLNDPKRPGAVAAGLSFVVIQVCDEDLANGAGSRVVDEDGNETFEPSIVTNAVPDGWYVRIMFDELLLADAVEELLPVLDSEGLETGFFSGSLLNTQPVTLRCGGVEVDYDGYYSPSGNAITWALGPSLFIQPVDPSTVASSSECTVELRDTIIDKDNIQVPADQRGGQDYRWQIDALAFAGTSPAGATECDSTDPEDDTCGTDGVCQTNDTCDDEETIAADSPLTLGFNGFIDPATLEGAEVTILEHATASCVDPNTTVIDDADKVIGGNPLNHVLTVALGNAGAGLAWVADRAYTVTITAAPVADVAGGPATVSTSLCFLTEAP